jgi:hypothetical protein
VVLAVGGLSLDRYYNSFGQAYGVQALRHPGRSVWQGIVAVEVYRVRIMSHVGGVTVLSPIVLRRARTPR